MRTPRSAYIYGLLVPIIGATTALVIGCNTSSTTTTSVSAASPEPCGLHITDVDEAGAPTDEVDCPEGQECVDGACVVPGDAGVAPID